MKCGINVLFPARLRQGELQQEELFVAVEMLSAVALINQAIDAGHMQQFSSSVVSSSAGLSDVEHTLLDRCDSLYLLCLPPCCLWFSVFRLVPILFYWF